MSFFKNVLFKYDVTIVIIMLTMFINVHDIAIVITIHYVVVPSGFNLNFVITRDLLVIVVELDKQVETDILDVMDAEVSKVIEALMENG